MRMMELRLVPYKPETYTLKQCDTMRRNAMQEIGVPSQPTLEKTE